MSEIPNELRDWGNRTLPYTEDFHYVERIASYIEVLEFELIKCRKEIQEANQCIEDVCTGAHLICPDCNKTRPCLCHDTGGQP